jgi:hypothetical protein
MSDSRCCTSIRALSGNRELAISCAVFQPLAVATTIINVLWDMEPCGIVEIY